MTSTPSRSRCARRSRVSGSRFGAHGDAPIQGAVIDGVAVALDQLEQGVGEGVLQTRAGAEAVGDRGDQALPFLLLGREVREPCRRQLDGHEHRLSLREALRLDPVQDPVVVVRRARLQARLQRVEHAVVAILAYQLVVRAAGARHPREPVA